MYHELQLGRSPRLIRGAIAALSASGQPAQMALVRRRKGSRELDEKDNDRAALVTCSERVVIVAVMGVDTARAGGAGFHGQVILACNAGRFEVLSLRRGMAR